MDMRTVYPSRWWMPEDFDNIGKTFRIGLVDMHQVGSGFRPCAFFNGVEKGLVIWEATGKMLSEALGTSETENWIGREITLYSFDGTNNQGKAVKRLGVRVPVTQPATAAPTIQKAAPKKPQTDEMNDEVPF